MTADRQRQVAEVLRGSYARYFTDGPAGVADALAPLIGQWREQDRAEGAAEALEAAADALSHPSEVAWLRDRAAALPQQPPPLSQTDGASQP